MASFVANSVRPGEERYLALARIGVAPFGLAAQLRDGTAEDAAVCFFVDLQKALCVVACARGA